MRPTSKHAGFTLVEMIIVIAIVGIVGSMVAVFMRAPIESYVAQDRRARLADTADTALRRMGREVRLALPNSVRVTTVAVGAVNVSYLEFLGTRDGGRYRTQIDPAVAGSDPLVFTVADSSFDVLGPPITMQAGNLIAVYNLGIAGANAWAVGTPGDTLAVYSGAAGAVNTITLAPAKLFPQASPGNRFQVVTGPVTYECNPAAGTLTRFWGYARAAAQPTPPAAPASSALLATGVSDCNITYQPGITERGGLVSMTLDLTREGETVRLYSSMQVENQP
ncbi:MAG TPA: prepilin-type N-terminal cleavage/methylation domain-containing protein [Thiobacillus sp.]